MRRGRLRRSIDRREISYARIHWDPKRPGIGDLEIVRAVPTGALRRRLSALPLPTAPADMPILRRMWQKGVRVDRKTLAVQEVSLKSLLQRSAGAARNGGANT